MLQIIGVLVGFMLLILPMGRYIYHIAAQKPTFADPVFDRVDQVLFKLIRVKKTAMTWKTYALAFLLTNAVMTFLGYVVLRIQALLFLNPNKIGNMGASLSFNTVISFMTNTNLQHYAGESGLSYLSQMIVIIFMMFTSAASGFAVAMAFIRGLSTTGKTLGNFYVDFVRIITRVLLPLSLIGGLLLVWQGVPQNLTPNLTVQTIEGHYQDTAMGPVAALEIIKHLGTNGGGFFGANSASPFENPTVITNMLEIIAMMLLPGSLVVAFGLMVQERKKTIKQKKNNWLARQARLLLIAMSVLFVLGLIVCLWAEQSGNPLLKSVGLSQSMGNMEGKEMRFGIPQSALFTTVTTAFTTGSVNNMHDTLTPLGGGVALVNMLLNVVFGGKGVGLMNMILYAILAVFICGLMIGRTPEYLGKKIEGREMKLTALGIIIHPLLILAFTALALAVPAGLAGITNPGYHGLTQVFYEYASSAANNGSGFEGLADNTTFWNLTTGLVMFFGRYLLIIIQLAIAGSLMMKRPVNESVGSLKTDTGTFTVALLMVILIICALTFFPAVVLGPIAEHVTLWK